MSSIHGRCCVDTIFMDSQSSEDGKWHAVGMFVICALGLEVGRPLSTENIKIHRKVTTASEVGAITSCGIKTCVDTSWKCLIFFYVTRCGAFLSSLDELSRFGLTETQVYARLPAVSRLLHSPPAALSLWYSQQECVEWYYWLLLNLTDILSPLNNLYPPQWIGLRTVSLMMSHVHPRRQSDSIFVFTWWLFRDSQILSGKLSAGVKGSFFFQQ